MRLCRYTAGSFYGDLQDFLKGEDTSQFGFTPYSSMVISRRRDDPLDRLGSEMFVPARLLFGVLPDALLAQFQVRLQWVQVACTLSCGLVGRHSGSPSATAKPASPHL